VAYSPNGIVPREAVLSSKRYHWTTREIAALSRTYQHGIIACMDALPGRSDRAIYGMAGKLGLKSPRMPAARRQWSSTEHVDDAIRRGYQKPDRGTINRLAIDIQRPRTWIRDRAIKLGIAVPRYKPLPWSPEEDLIVRELAGQRKPASIQRALRKDGFARTETAIVVRMKRLGESRVIESVDEYSGRQLADMMGVDGKTVSTWVSKGLLRAKEVGEPRSDGRATTWRIKRKDVRRFIIDHTAHVDLRKVEKFWFVDLLGVAA
jgi:DNA-directed RNA polymerase specialized sigma24 family protein